MKHEKLSVMRQKFLQDLRLVFGRTETDMFSTLSLIPFPNCMISVLVTCGSSYSSSVLFTLHGSFTTYQKAAGSEQLA